MATYYGEYVFKGLVHYWKLDEATGSVIDSVGGIAGIITGSITQGTAGKAGTSYTFNETGYINVGSSIENETVFTIAMWAKNGNPQERYAARREGGNVHFDWYSNSSVAGRMALYTGGSQFTCTFDVNADTEWHFVAVVVNGSKTFLWADDSISPGTSGYTGNYFDPNIQIASPQIPLLIGTNNDVANTHWSGSMDEIAIWNRALSESELRLLYNNPTTLNRYY